MPLRLRRFEEAPSARGSATPPAESPPANARAGSLHAPGGAITSRAPGPAAPLTLFAAPKAFTGLTAIIQRNAIRSWTCLSPRPEVILLGRDEGVAEAAHEIGAIHIPDLEVTPKGTPLLSSLFELAQRRASGGVLAYVNADIILGDDFAKAAATLAGGEPFLAIGRRWDLDVLEEFDFTPGWFERLKADARSRGILHASSGIDYFLFSKGLFRDVLPFALGRTCWDNWLVWEALREGARLVDCTPSVTIIHQEHPYTHQEGGAREVWRGEEANRNRALAGGNTATIAHAPFALEGAAVVMSEARHRYPEPGLQANLAFKYRQARDAERRGDFFRALDHLTYIEMHLAAGCVPRGLFLLKAALLLRFGDLAGAKKAAAMELACFPDSSQAKSALQELGTVDPAALALESRALPVTEPARTGHLQVEPVPSAPQESRAMSPSRSTRSPAREPAAREGSTNAAAVPVARTLCWGTHEEAARLGVAGGGTRAWAYRWIEEHVKAIPDIGIMVDLGGGGIEREYSRRMAGYAQQYMVVDLMGTQATRGNRTQIVWDMEKGLQPFPDESVDVFISASAIEHLTYRGQLNLFREMERCLRPGGVFCGTVSFIERLTPETIRLLQSDPTLARTGSPISCAFDAFQCMSQLARLRVPFPPQRHDMFPGFAGFTEHDLLDNEALIHDLVGSHGSVCVKPEIDALKLKWYEMGIFLIKDSRQQPNAAQVA